MKGVVVYDMSYGNTKKIGETIVETLKQSGLERTKIQSKRWNSAIDDFYHGDK